MDQGKDRPFGEIVPLYNPFALADHLARAWIGFYDSTRMQRDKFEDMLLSSKRVINFERCSGPYNFVVDLGLEWSEEPGAVISNFLNGFSLEAATAVSFPREIYRWGFAASRESGFQKVRSRRAPVRFSSSTRMREFSKQEATNILELCTPLDVYGSSATDKLGIVQKLERKGFLIRRKVAKPFSKVPPVKQRILARFVETISPDSEILEKALRLGQGIPQIVGLSVMSGDWNLEYDTLIRTTEETGELKAQITEIFDGDIAECVALEQHYEVDRGVVRVQTLVEERLFH